MLIQEYISEHNDAVNTVLRLEKTLDYVAHLMQETLISGGTIFFCGNGGSAADAQHLAAELVGTFSNKKRKPLKAIALTTDSSCLTSVANDFDFNQIFVRQIEALCDSNDMIFLISTSGNSLNLLNAAQASKRIGASTVGMLGNGGGHLGDMVDIQVVVESDRTSIIQECHIMIGHFLCYKLEAFYNEK